MKKYVKPMLHVISIKKNDILTESASFSTTATDVQLDGGRRFDDYDAGY